MTLRDLKHFQAIAMLVRSLFEISVEIRLLKQTPDGQRKIIAYTDVEKLRSAKKIVTFKAANPGAALDVSIYEEFIKRQGERIDTERMAVWPGVKNSDLQHWSRMNLRERADFLKEPFDRLYAFNYAQLSWYVHPGLTGVLNLPKETFRAVAGVAFLLASESYVAILTDMIDELKLTKANEKIKELMKLARTMPFTDTPEQARAIVADLMR